MCLQNIVPFNSINVLGFISIIHKRNSSLSYILSLSFTGVATKIQNTSGIVSFENLKALVI